MQVILFKNIERLGMQGDVVNVASGYFRNYLGPRGIALEATATNLGRLEIKRKKLHEEAQRQVNEAGDLAKRLSGVPIKFVMKATDNERLFGSVADHDILEKLNQAGFAIERRQIILREPIKTVGTHNVKIKLVGHVEGQVTVVVEAEGLAAPTPAPAAAAAPAPGPETKASEAES
jgi:large subunit ribosomal protein L9